MNHTPVLKKTRELILKQGPMSTEELREFHFPERSLGDLTDLLESCWYVTKDDSNRWHLTSNATDRDKLENYPPDVEPLPDYDEFFSELGELIEEHETDEEERYRYLCGCIEFGESWKAEPRSW